jgi:hypothetical protein
MTRSLSTRLAAIESAAGQGGPLVAFPAGDAALYLAGVRHDITAGETLAAAARRVASIVRPGAEVTVWPLPLCPALDGAA